MYADTRALVRGGGEQPGAEGLQGGVDLDRVDVVDDPLSEGDGHVGTRAGTHDQHLSRLDLDLLVRQEVKGDRLTPLLHRLDRLVGNSVHLPRDGPPWLGTEGDTVVGRP